MDFLFYFSSTSVVPLGHSPHFWIFQINPRFFLIRIFLFVHFLNLCSCRSHSSFRWSSSFASSLLLLYSTLLESTVHSSILISSISSPLPQFHSSSCTHLFHFSIRLINPHTPPLLRPSLVEPHSLLTRLVDRRRQLLEIFLSWYNCDILSIGGHWTTPLVGFSLMDNQWRRTERKPLVVFLDPCTCI